MNLIKVKQVVEDLPYMSLKKAQVMEDFIHKHSISNILELGFFHGVSTCYMAAALEEVDQGSIVSIDLHSAQKRQPNIEELLEKCGYLETVEFYYEPVSYNWRLMKLIEAQERTFDLCYLDGGHDWYNTGLAFFLVDKLLRPGGWINQKKRELHLKSAKYGNYWLKPIRNTVIFTSKAVGAMLKKLINEMGLSLRRSLDDLVRRYTIDKVRSL
jgi:hypothetical protein